MGCQLYPNITCLNPTEAIREILEKFFITKKCAQRKTLHTLKNDVFELSDNEILENCFQNMDYFPWMKLSTVLIHLK